VRWLRTGGDFGDCPDWYPTLKAAIYLHVSPWELARQSVVWQRWALAAQAAEEESRPPAICPLMKR
jgi:hypothetical protein